MLTLIKDSLPFYLALAACIVVVVILMRRRLIRLAFVLLFIFLLIDLSIYASKVIPTVTEPREKIFFNEHGTEYSLQKHRIEKPYLDKRFWYYISTLRDTQTALDGNVIDYIFLYKNGCVSQILDRIRDGSFPFLEEIKRLSMFEFIKLGRNQFEGWDRIRKEDYLNFLSLALGEMIVKEKYYSIFPGISSMFEKLKYGIYTGFVAISRNSLWADKESTISTFEDVLNLNFKIRPDVADKVMQNGGTLLDMRSLLVREFKLHEYIFKKMNTLEYFLSLWMRFRNSIASTFVRLNDFDEIAKLYEAAAYQSVTNESMLLIHKRIKDDLGVTSPIIDFYTYANFLPRGGYLSLLKESTVNNSGLYLEEPNIDTLETISVTAPPDFSYEVLDYNPNYLRLVYTVNNPGYLYYSDCFEKYWRARIDKKSAHIYKANGAFKAIKVPGGKHVVEFIYSPIIFRFSLWLYYSITIGCIYFLIFKRKRA